MIEEALKIATEPLVCDQVECHPFLDQSKVIAACRRHGMAVVAYSPIARGNARNDEVLEASAQRIRRPRRKSACVFWCSRTSSSFRAPAKSSG